MHVSEVEDLIGRQTNSGVEVVCSAADPPSINPPVSPNDFRNIKPAL